MLLIVAFSVILAASLSYVLFAFAGVSEFQVVAALIFGLLLQLYIARMVLSLGRTTRSSWVNPDKLTSKARSFAFAIPTALVLAAVGAFEGFRTLIGAVQFALAAIVLAAAMLAVKVRAQTPSS